MAETRGDPQRIWRHQEKQKQGEREEMQREREFFVEHSKLAKHCIYSLHPTSTDISSTIGKRNNCHCLPITAYQPVYDVRFCPCSTKIAEKYSNPFYFRKRKDPVGLVPEVPFRKVDVILRLKPGEDLNFDVNDQLYLISMNTEHPGGRELILGDKIMKINGKVPNSKMEAQAMLAVGGELSLSLQRRQSAAPCPPDRLRSVCPQKMPGFSYFVVTCIKDPKELSPSFGFTVNLIKNKAHVMAVEPKSIASRYFSIGDALMDLDGQSIPFNDIEFLKGYAQRFFKQGRFSAAVERAVAPDSVVLYNRLFKLMLPPESDVEMGVDALIIGKEAAAMHRMVLSKLRPRSVLSSDVQQITKHQTVDTTVEGKGVKIISRSLETRIGSDVEDEDDLKPVERKSHSDSSSYSFDDF